jgi:hypothetical protein
MLLLSTTFPTSFAVFSTILLVTFQKSFGKIRLLASLKRLAKEILRNQAFSGEVSFFSHEGAIIHTNVVNEVFIISSILSSIIFFGVRSAIALVIKF